MGVNGSPYLTAEEAADYLRVSVHTLRAYRNQGKGPPYHRIGGKTLYHRDEVDAWVQSGRQEVDR